MKNIAILGGSWGDEGKGAITHHFSSDFDWVIRFSGGANAGHTIYREGVKYVHNLLPSFDWRIQNTKAFLGSGMVIDIEQLHLEVSKIFNICQVYVNKIYVDPDAFIVTAEHKNADKFLNGHIGSTNRGIGPAYAEKMSRSGLRIRDVMLSADTTKDQILINELKKMGVHFKGVLDLRTEFMHSKLLFEGAQGVMLDINHGIYPYVSCGDSTIAGIYAAGFNFITLDKVFGVVKAYSTKVGEGPFPTEIHNEEAHNLREMGKEYGATTGRPRRVGWIDLPALDYACKKGGITDLVVTKFDILNNLPSVKMCTSYDRIPSCSNDFFDAKPHYINVPGWTDAHDHKQIIPFINAVEQFTNRSVNYISCGTAPRDIMPYTFLKDKKI